MDSRGEEKEAMTAAEARKIVDIGVMPGTIDSVDLAEAKGFLEGMKASEVKALVRCATEAREYLKDHGISLVDDLGDALSDYRQAVAE